MTFLVVENEGQGSLVAESGVELHEDKRRSDLSQRDVDDFRNAMERKNENASAESRRRAETEKQILTTLTRQTIDLQPQAMFVAAAAQLDSTQAALQAAATKRSLAEMVAKFVDQIFVHEMALKGGREIQLQLKDRLLSGTRVQIVRNGNSLRVVFHAQSALQADLIAQQQGVLRAALLERMQLDDVDILTQLQDRELNGEGFGRHGKQQAEQEEDENSVGMKNPWADDGSF
jgi:hypothetical protein